MVTSIGAMAKRSKLLKNAASCRSRGPPEDSLGARTIALLVSLIRQSSNYIRVDVHPQGQAPASFSNLAILAHLTRTPRQRSTDERSQSGFSTESSVLQAPSSGQRQRLPWLAGRRDWPQALTGHRPLKREHSRSLFLECQSRGSRIQKPAASSADSIGLLGLARFLERSLKTDIPRWWPAMGYRLETRLQRFPSRITSIEG